MPDPEGFKLGSAWMDVKPNIDQTEWDAKVSAALAEAGKGASISAGSAAGTSPLGRSLVQGLEDAKPELVRGADEIGAQVGDTLGTSTADHLGQGLLAKMYPKSFGDGEQIGAGIGDGLSKGVEPGLDEADRKIKDKAGQAGKDAGAAAGQGMSPLIVSAIAGAASIGGPLLLAGLGGAMVGATALILKQNKVISADFTQVGKDAGNAIQLATAPLTVDMHQALVQADHDVNALQPDLKNLFAAAEPDISAVTSGLTGFAGAVIPGVAKAVSTSQVIVSDFSQSLPALGSGIGSFFSGLVHNADLQGQALQQTVGVLGNAFRTVGDVIGSASATASADLLALTPVVNGLLTAVDAVSSPATVGGLAGLFGAMKLDPGIQSGLLSGAEGLSKVADKAEEAGGLVGKISGAAGGASGALAKMAGVVGGPWGLAIGAGIGLASGLAAELFHADTATQAITVNAQNLQDAVARDGAAAGEATTMYIAAQAQLSGLADEAKNAGVSLDTLAQAAIGNRDAQAQLSSSVNDTNKASRAQQMVSEQTLSGFNNLNSSMATGNDLLVSSAEQTNTLTSANQQLVNSVQAQAQQTADAIEKQAQLNAATVTLNNATNIFNATMDDDYQKLTAKSQASAETTVATLNLGVAQSGLNQALAGVVQQYDLASQGGNAYESVLTALDGTTSNLYASAANFTIALDGVSKAAAANGRSLDQNNAKGAQNVLAFTQLAASADKAAAAVYENEVNTKGANQAFADANQKLLAEKNAFEQAAIKAGFSSDKVKSLADQLFKLPSDVPINVDANTSPARSSVAHLLNDINASQGTIQVYASSGNVAGGKALGAGRASGGPVTAGSMIPVGEYGEETAVFGQDAYILTHGQTVGMQSQAKTTAPVVNATFNYYGAAGGQASPETKAQMMRDLALALA